MISKSPQFQQSAGPTRFCCLSLGRSTLWTCHHCTSSISAKQKNSRNYFPKNNTVQARWASPQTISSWNFPGCPHLGRTHQVRIQPFSLAPFHLEHSGRKVWWGRFYPLLCKPTTISGFKSWSLMIRTFLVWRKALFPRLESVCTV